jgi:hypothetical protein
LCYYCGLIDTCNFRNLTKKAKQQDVGKLCWPDFFRMFKEKNLAIHKLKKDRCDYCVKYELSQKADTLTQDKEDEMSSHKDQVLRTKYEKDNDKQLNKDDNLVLVVDVEKILLYPKLNNSLHYYLHKVQMKNYTCYDMHTRHATCFLFDEVNAGSDSNTYATLLCDLIESRLIEQPSITSVIVWSDGCCHQNRNCTLSNAILNLAITWNITIYQKYLVTGHSHNEGDNIHSVIETCMKNRILYTPEDYCDMIQNAHIQEELGGKKNARAYKVEMVSFDKIKSYEELNIYHSIRPGSKPGDPTVNLLRALQYLPNGTINYKLNFKDEWTPMLHKLNKPTYNITQKYASQLPVSAAKWRDIQKLKEFIPQQHHAFFDSIPHM